MTTKLDGMRRNLRCARNFEILQLFKILSDIVFTPQCWPLFGVIENGKDYLEGEAYIKNYHDPDFARISLAHQTAFMTILYFKNNLYFNKDDSFSFSFIIVSPNIPADARWNKNGVTVAGGHGDGNATNQLSSPNGLFIDDNQTIVIGEWGNNRVVQWKMNDTEGQVIAGNHGSGNLLDQLTVPTDVLIDEESDSVIICDLGNQRVVQWSRRSGTKQGEILIDNINCYGLAMDDQRYLYVSAYSEDEVRRYQIGDKNGTVVAGGHGKGDALNQLNSPGYIFVDQQQTLYVSDYRNNRVMKWNKDAKEGILVAGGQGAGNATTQVSLPQGLVVDTLGTIYVADTWNLRVMRWPAGAKQGTVIAGGNGAGTGPTQFNRLEGLSFDRQGNLYVSDDYNNRIQRFSIE